MKEYKFLIIGGLVVIGVIAYKVYKHFHNTQDGCNETEPLAESDSCATEEVSPSSKSCVSSDVNGFEVREAAVVSIKVRHHEAAKVMKESLNTIFRESKDEDVVTENSEILSKTGSELNDLLK